jgi:hypothetical protein
VSEPALQADIPDELGEKLKKEAVEGLPAGGGPVQSIFEQPMPDNQDSDLNGTPVVSKQDALKMPAKELKTLVNQEIENKGGQDFAKNRGEALKKGEELGIIG